MTDVVKAIVSPFYDHLPGRLLTDGRLETRVKELRESLQLHFLKIQTMRIVSGLLIQIGLFIYGAAAIATATRRQ